MPRYLTQAQFDAQKQYRRQLGVHPQLAQPIPETQPPEHDLRSKLPTVYDQGQIGSCTANALSMSLRILDPQFNPSRLYLYVKERLAELAPGQQLSDDGADAIDGLHILINQGICSEEVWPYDIGRVNTIPPATCDEDAAKHKIKTVGTVAPPGIVGQPLISAIAQSLLQGLPVDVTIQVFASFESEQVAKTGIVPLPRPNEEYLGGHEVLIIGYDNNLKRFLLVNSWGPNWGIKGLFYLPYDYITNPELVSEFIAITLV